MLKLNDIVDKLGSDKVIHFLVEVLIVGTIAILDKELFNRNVLIAAAIGASVGILVGVVKELIDFFSGKQFDLQDLKFDLYGVAVGLLWALILSLI